MAAFKFVGMLSGLKAVFAALKGKSLLLALSSILKGGAMGGPIGIAATVAAAIAGYATVRALTKSVDDFKSGPGGINYMSGPAGAFALNPRDSVLATTNPIPVNDITTAPAGALGNMSKMEGLLEGIFRATSSEKTIVTDSQVKRISYTGGLGGGLNPYG